MTKLDHCPVCNNNTSDSFLKCKDYTVSKDIFDIVKCKSCGFAFTNPRPIEEKIGGFYESDEYISHSNTSKGVINSIYQKVRNYTISKKISLLKTLSSEKKLLDIGSGTGEFLNAAKQKGFDVTGAEPSETARSFSNKTYNLNVTNESSLSSYSPDSFDFITMWHVLEHVYHLNDRILEIKRLLSIDGHVIIAVPNLNSYDAKHYEEHWAAYDLPRHLYHFSPETIEMLFEKHGLKLVKKLPMIFDSFYVSMLSEKYKTGKSNLLKALYVGLKSNVKARTNKNYSSQIYIFKKN